MPDNDRSLITLNGEPIPGRIEGSDGMWALRVIGRHIYWPDRRVRAGRVLADTLDELVDAYLAENLFGCECEEGNHGVHGGHAGFDPDG